MHRFPLRAALALATVIAATPASAQGHRWDWTPGGFRLAGPGVRLLYPELRDDRRGQAFVMRNFDWNRDGLIGPREAEAANRAFLDAAGPRFDRGRERFDWDRHGAAVVVVDERAAPDDRGARWDRAGMRGLGFRQTERGAMLDLSADVLFATDSATLRPGAIDRLRPLAGYLRDTDGVRVAIDGYTDARGSDAHNQDLSQRRAASVRDALVDMGAERARFAIVGHGEREPVATNATAAGMRQNRRVDVTLIGRRATEFDDR